MTTVQNTKELLHRKPFAPFRVRLTSGDFYDIRDPHRVVAMKTRLFIVLPKSDRSVFVPYLHIAALEPMTKGRRGESGGRRRKAG